MQLKISSITNLTDARFFSAIGAHYLGFCFDVLNPNNISIEKAKEIIGWLHEPVVVGEFGTHQSKEEIEFIAQQMGLNEIQLPYEHSQKNEFIFEKFLLTDDWFHIDNQQSSDFFVLRIGKDEIDELLKQVQQDGTGLSDSLRSLQQFICNKKVFIETDFTKENIVSILETLQPYGIQLTCKQEERAGISAVDEYAELLEIIGFS